MVFGVVHQSGGTVRILSRLHEGTTVQIYLPRAMDAAAPASTAVARTETVGGAHILVVDDDPDIGGITGEGLREMGYAVTEAESGRAALAVLERGDPICDLMVVDLVMPGLSGVDTVRLARRVRPDLKVVFTTGYADMSMFAADLGNDVVLKKPFTPRSLAVAVGTALRRVSRGEDNIVLLRRARTQLTAATDN